MRSGNESVQGGDVDAQGGCGGVQIGDESAQGDGVGRQSVGVRGGGTRDGGVGAQRGNVGVRGEDVNPRYVPADESSTVSVSSEAIVSARSGVSCGAKVLSFSTEKVSLQPRGVPVAFAKPPVITGEGVSFLEK